MSQADQFSFSCSACGKQFRWKPEIAGKKGKCGCGTVFQAPMTMPKMASAKAAEHPSVKPAGAPVRAAPAVMKRPAAAKPVKMVVPPVEASIPASDPPSLDDLYDIVEETPKVRSPMAAPVTVPDTAPCPSCGSALQPGAVLCVQCGYNVRARTKVATAARPSASAAVDASEIATHTGRILPTKHFQAVVKEEEKPESPILHVYLPIVIIGAGLVLTFVEKIYAGSEQNVTGASVAPMVLLGIIANLGLVLAAMFIVSSTGTIAFTDPPWRLVLKLCACALPPGPIGQIIFHAMGGDENISASITMVFAGLALYWALFMLFFRLDFQDTVICVFSVIIIKSFVEYGLYRLESWKSGSWI